MVLIAQCQLILEAETLCITDLRTRFPKLESAQPYSTLYVVVVLVTRSTFGATWLVSLWREGGKRRELR